MKPNVQEIKTLVEMINKIDDPHSFRIQASRLVPYMVDLLQYVDTLEEIADAARKESYPLFDCTGPLQSGETCEVCDCFKTCTAIAKLDGDG